MADNGSIKKSCYCRVAVENFDVAKQDVLDLLYSILRLLLLVYLKRRIVSYHLRGFSSIPFTNDSIIHAIEKSIYIRELKSFSFKCVPANQIRSRCSSIYIYIYLANLSGFGIMQLPDEF